MTRRSSVVEWLVEGGSAWLVTSTFLTSEDRAPVAIGQSWEAFPMPADAEYLSEQAIQTALANQYEQWKAARADYDEVIFGPASDPPAWLQGRPGLPTKLVRTHTPTRHAAGAFDYVQRRAARGRATTSEVMLGLAATDTRTTPHRAGRRRARSLAFDLGVLEVIESTWADGGTLEQAATAARVSQGTAKELLRWGRHLGYFEPTTQGKRTGPKRMTAQGRALLEELVALSPKAMTSSPTVLRLTPNSAAISRRLRP